MSAGLTPAAPPSDTDWRSAVSTFALKPTLGAAYAMFGIGSAIGAVAGVALWGVLGRGAWVLIGAVSVPPLLPAWFAMGRVGSTTSLTDGSG